MSTIEQTAHKRLSKMLQRNGIEFQDSSNANDATMSIAVYTDKVKEHYFQIFVPNAMFVIEEAVDFNTYSISFHKEDVDERVYNVEEFNGLDGVLMFLKYNLKS